MTPYYEQDGITIYHGDCRNVLPGIVWSATNAVLSDPPYGIGKAEWDSAYADWWLPLAAEIAPRVGVMPGTWNLLRLPMVVGALRYKWTLAAHLTNGMTRGALGYGNWIPCVMYGIEPVPVEWTRRFALWCSAAGITRRDLDRITGTSDMSGWWLGELEHRSAIPAPHQWERILAHLQPPAELGNDVYAGAWESGGDARDFAISGGPKPDHPCPKPLPVVRWFTSRMVSDVVIDPFMGSGTTLVAARDLGRRAIGIEIEERYCEIAARRLDQGVLNLGAA